MVDSHRTHQHPLVDSHCHLDRLDLTIYQGDLDRAMLAARDAGVSHMLCVAISKDKLADVLDIAQRYANVYASVGVHPLEHKELDISAEHLARLARHPKVVAVGESGLDYHYADNKQEQRLSFRAHLEAASESEKPVIVHSRAAQQDTLDLLREALDRETGGVMHCFTESWEMARQALDMNMYISFSGIITFNNAHELREVVKKVPLDRMLIETDSPYLAPVPNRGKPNEPKYLLHVAQCVAELKGLPLEEVARVTSANFFDLFPIPAKIPQSY